MRYPGQFAVVLELMFLPPLCPTLIILNQLNQLSDSAARISDFVWRLHGKE
jgi:hypothetical protein